MSYQTAPQSGPTGWGVAYKVALGVVAVGVLTIVLGLFVGGLLYTLVITPLVELMGAPADRDAFAPSQTENGALLLALIGAGNIVVGFCMFFVRLTLDLVGLTNQPSLTRRMTPERKLALGTASPGVVALLAGGSSRMFLAALFEDHQSEVAWIMPALDAVWHVGLLLLLCAFMTRFFQGRWADAVGWAKLRWGWLNRLSAALFVTGIIGAIPLFPFADVAGAFTLVGLAVLAMGIFPQILAGGKP